VQPPTPVPTLKQTPYLGSSFVLLVVACVVLAGGLLISDRREVWLLVAAVDAMTISDQGRRQGGCFRFWPA
jgi:hypothetical protein